jgi:hypothetical protein
MGSAILTSTSAAALLFLPFFGWTGSATATGAASSSMSIKSAACLRADFLVGLASTGATSSDFLGFFAFGAASDATEMG